MCIFFAINFANKGPLIIAVGTAVIKPNNITQPKSAFNISATATGPGVGGIKECVIAKPANKGIAYNNRPANDRFDINSDGTITVNIERADNYISIGLHQNKIDENEYTNFYLNKTFGNGNIGKYNIRDCKIYNEELKNSNYNNISDFKKMFIKRLIDLKTELKLKTKKPKIYLFIKENEINSLNLKNYKNYKNYLKDDINHSKLEPNEFKFELDAEDLKKTHKNFITLIIQKYNQFKKNGKESHAGGSRKKRTRKRTVGKKRTKKRQLKPNKLSRKKRGKVSRKKK